MSKNLSQQIMEQIHDKKVKMKSRWIFIAQKLGLESGLALAIILAVLLVNSIFYIMQRNGAFEFASFGLEGWRVILDNIPYDLIIALIILIITANYIYKKFDLSYHKPLYYFTLLSICLITLVGTFLAYSGVNEEIIEEKLVAENTHLDSPGNLPPQYIIRKTAPRAIYQNRINFQPVGDRAIIGSIIDCRDDEIIIRMYNSQIITLKPNTNGDFVCQIGKIIKSIGQKEANIFRSHIIQIIEK